MSNPERQPDVVSVSADALARALVQILHEETCRTMPLATQNYWRDVFRQAILKQALGTTH